MTSLAFLGAARTVTGSRLLVSAGRRRVLVDCGLYQGRKDLRLRNWAPFPVAPASIDAVVLTHAHVDHCGYLPALVRDGFAGRVLASASTVELAQIVLPDSGRLQEEDAAYANRHGTSKHTPALPLFTEADAHAALARLDPADFHVEYQLGDAPGDIVVTLAPAGHILGSAVVTIDAAGRRIVCSGDLGRRDHPLLVAPSPPPAADAIVVESTYGDRTHDDAGAAARLADAVRTTAARDGVIVIPAFAVDRTEVVLRLLARLEAQGAIPRVPVYVDSPLALAALSVYRAALTGGAADVRRTDALDAAPLEPSIVHEVRTVEESKALNRLDGPMIIVSASGMATGGRVLHHLIHRLPHSRNAVVLVGHQVEGTRGRRLLDGESPVKMLGQWVAVRAAVVDCTGLSVHADRDELLDWVAGAPEPPEQVFVVHGEPEPAEALAAGLRARTGARVCVPDLGAHAEV